MNCLITFAKYPEQGKVKSKLSREIGERFAAELYEAFLLDLYTNHSEQDYELFVAIHNAEDEDKFKQLIPSTNFYTQKGHNLGERLLNAFKDFSISYEKIVIIASDVPTISSETINNAFNVLKEKDVVLGPTIKGGYYLVGLRKPKEIFSTIKWSHEEVLQKTIELIEKNNLSYALLEKRADVNEFKDLKTYSKENLSECPNTLNKLSELDKYLLKNKI